MFKKFNQDWKQATKWQRVIYCGLLIIQIFMGYSTIRLCIFFTDSYKAKPDPTLAYFMLMLVGLAGTILIGRINVFITTKKESK